MKSGAKELKIAELTKRDSIYDKRKYSLGKKSKRSLNKLHAVSVKEKRRFSVGDMPYVFGEEIRPQFVLCGEGSRRIIEFL